MFKKINSLVAMTCRFLSGNKRQVRQSDSDQSNNDATSFITRRETKVQE